MLAFEPLTHRFRIELNLEGSVDNVDGTFMECRGFQYTQDVIEICEVTPLLWGTKQNKGFPVRTKIPGNNKIGNITLCRATHCSMTLWNWFDRVQLGQWAKQRQNASLTILNSKNIPNARFELGRAWPTSYKLTDISVNNTEYLIEEMEIAFEEFIRVPI